MAMGANSSRRSVVGLESREQSIRESSPVRESESRLTASQVSDSIKWHTQHIYTHRGKSLWQSVGDEVFSATLYNKWTLMNAQL